MRAISPLPPLWLIACVILTSLTGCDPKKSETETGSATASGTAEGATEAGSGEVPITTASDEARALYVRGRDLSEQLRTHEARKLFQQAVAKDSTFAIAHYDLAINSSTPGEFFGHVKRAVELSDHASDGERLLILSLEAGANGDSKKNLGYAEELVVKYPGDERAHTTLALLYSGQQQYEKSISHLTKAVEINPDYSPAYNLLGYAYMPMGQYPEAEKAFKKYIELVPSDPNPYDSYAELLMKIGRFDESIVQYKKALEKDAHFSGSQVGVANNLMLQGKHDEAAAEAQKLYTGARDDGDRRTALFTRTVIYLDQGKTAAALKEMEKQFALGAKSGDTAAMSNDASQIGDILLEAGRPDEAGKRYQQAFDLVQASGLSPEQKEFSKLTQHYDLARVALGKKDLAGAKAHAKQYQTGAEATQDVFRIRQAHELAGKIALQEKDFDGAVAHLGQADQQDPYVLYWMAVANQSKGDQAKAKELAHRAATVNSPPALRYSFVRAKAKKMG